MQEIAGGILPLEGIIVEKILPISAKKPQSSFVLYRYDLSVSSLEDMTFAGKDSIYQQPK